MHSDADISDALAKVVRRLTADVALPVDVLGCAQQLDVLITSQDRGDGVKGALVKLTNKPEIMLCGPPFPRHLTPKERFSIAHEIGHIIVWRQLGHAPSKADYWQHEKHANQFASALLLPRNIIRHVVQSWTIRSVLMPGKLGQLSEVSWDAAARAVADLPQPGCHFLRLRQREGLAVGLSYIVESSTIPARGGGYWGQKAVLKEGPLFDLCFRCDSGIVVHEVVSDMLGSLRLDATEVELLKDKRQVFVAIPHVKVGM